MGDAKIPRNAHLNLAKFFEANLTITNTQILTIRIPKILLEDCHHVENHSRYAIPLLRSLVPFKTKNC